MVSQLPSTVLCAFAKKSRSRHQGQSEAEEAKQLSVAKSRRRTLTTTWTLASTLVVRVARMNAADEEMVHQAAASRRAVAGGGARAEGAGTAVPELVAAPVELQLSRTRRPEQPRRAAVCWRRERGSAGNTFRAARRKLLPRHQLLLLLPPVLASQQAALTWEKHCTAAQNRTAVLARSSSARRVLLRCSRWSRSWTGARVHLCDDETRGKCIHRATDHFQIRI